MPSSQDLPSSMRAVRYHRYGPLEQLAVEAIPVPQPADDQVVVEVHAAGVHIGDVFSVRGTPLPVRAFTGLLTPKYGVPGFDLAGVVARVGAKVDRFQVGNRVFGYAMGACAEYVAAKAGQIAAIPGNLGFVEAAALPTSGLAALHALRDVATLEAGQRVLINGAAGGVGSYAVQIAKTMGAEVTGVCSNASAELVRSLGADEVIDYTNEDFTERRGCYDLIFDNIENRSLSEVRRALAPKGMAILNSGTSASGLAMLVRMLRPLVLDPFVGHRLRRYLSTPNHDDLAELGEMVRGGQVKPAIDKTFDLESTREALLYLDTGHAHGKVVVTVK